MKAKKQSKPPIQIDSSSGHIIEGNIWIKLGLSKNEANVLRNIASRYAKPTTSAHVARVILQVALVHFDIVKQLMKQDVHYTKSEGFICTDEYYRGLIARQLSKICPRKK